MGFESVDIHVRDSLGDPVSDVLVKIYDPAGAVFFTQATTSSEGVASLLLETISYSMRFYKYHTGFRQPQLFTVLPAPSTNIFDVAAELFVPPLATDPRLCRCSGFFRDLDGSPKRHLDIHFMPKFDAILLDDSAVISEERHLRTDDKGYAQIDLIRGAEYEARVESIDGNWLRCLRVPDQASANLPDILLPIVERVVLTPEGPYALTVGQEISVAVQVYDSAGVLLEGTALDDVDWRSSNTDLLLVSPTQTTLTIRGNAVGSVQVTATRKDLSIIKIPNLPIVGQPIDVTVS